MLEQLRMAIAMAPFMQRLTHGEATIGVADLTQYVAYFPGRTLNFGHKPGNPVKEGSGAWAAIHADDVVVNRQPASRYGVPYLAISMPLRTGDGETVGGLVCGLPIELEEELARMAAELAAAMTQFHSTFNGIASVAERTADAAGMLARTTGEMGSSLQASDSATTAITRITDQTRLLGLNALIEAAHAGTAGAGFGVVAREIQVLAERSLKATQEMARVIGNISERNGSLVVEADTLRADSEKLQAEVRQATGLVAELAAMATQLKTLAERTEQ